MQQQSEPNAELPEPTTPEVPFGSNEVRLTPGQWAAALVLLLAAVWLIPAAWTRLEPLDVTPDYRVPYRLGYDYWMYNRYCRRAAPGDKTLLVGDSVIWGHYVSADETLSHYLNKLAGEDRFANLGVDGIHPVAMAGLVDCYGRPIAGRDVILHCNLLWMSSRRHDLQTDKEFAFNHPELVPQFYPWIPCYRESLEGRLDRIVGRTVPFLGWARHVRIAYFDGATLPRWTIERPYADPASAVTFELPSPDELPSPKPIAEPWTAKQLPRFDPSWVELETSLQWRSFQRTIDILRRRGNRVFVLIGPFNEPMLTDNGLRGYRELQGQVEACLASAGVAYYSPKALPSECYADASHPLADGYALLAKEVFESEVFRGYSSAP
jgi:hypothetical protein